MKTNIKLRVTPEQSKATLKTLIPLSNEEIDQLKQDF